jgi:hypothetical protein
VLQRANWFRVNWRGEAMRDGAMAIQKVNLKAQKVDGTVYVELMRQSVVAVPAPGGGTQLEIVRHIDAPGESETTAADGSDSGSERSTRRRRACRSPR